VTFQYLASKFSTNFVFKQLIYTKKLYSESNLAKKARIELFNEKLIDDAGGALVSEYLIQMLVGFIQI